MNGKEPLPQSARFRLFISGVVLEILIGASPYIAPDIPLELLQTIAAGVAGLVAVMIYSRTQRNTK